MAKDKIRLEKIAPFVLILLSIIIYLPTISGEFVWDDHQLIEQNAQIQELNNASKALVSGFVSTSWLKTSYYRPIIIASYTLDFLLWDHQSPGYHLTNLFLNALACILVYATALLILGNPWAAFAAGALFAAHPTHAESVAWISGRTDILAVIFLLPSFIFYVRHVNAKAGWKWLGLSALFMLLALLTKETVVVFPAIWLIYGFAIARRSPVGLLLDALVLGVAAAIYLVLRYNVDLSYLSPYYIVKLKYRVLALPDNLFNALRLMYLPIRGEPYHRFTFSLVLSNRLLIFQWVALTGACVAYFQLWRRSRIAAFTLAWAVVGAWPVFNLIQLTKPIMAERFLYLGTIGASLGFGLAVRYLLTLRPKAAIAAGMGVVILVVCWSVGASVGAKPWHDEISLWTRITTLADQDTRGAKFWTFERAEYYTNLSMAYYRNGRNKEALTVAKKAIKIQPKYAAAHSMAGAAYGALGKEKECLQEYRISLNIAPKQPDVLSNFGSELLRFGHYKEAMTYLKDAIRLVPDLYVAHRNLGYIYQRLGKYEESRDSFAKAVELMPKDLPARMEYGLALLRLGQRDKAAEQFKYIMHEASGGPEAEVARQMLLKIQKPAQP